MTRLQDWLRQESLWDGFARLGALFRPWRGRKPHRPKRPPKKYCHPELEPLERRELLSAVQFSSSSYSIGESTTPLTVTVVLDTSVGIPGGSVQYAASAGTASGMDFLAAAGTLNFMPGGATSQTFTVTITSDSLDEDDETINLLLHSPTGALSLGSPVSATATITDDDASPSVSFNSSSGTMAETSGNVTATVTLSAVSGRSVLVPYTTSGTATGGGTDYSASPTGTLTFAAGDLSKTIALSSVSDTLDEYDETAILTLSTPTNASLGATTVYTGTITDDDAAPNIRFTASSSSVGEGAGQATFTAELYSGTATVTSGKTITVKYTAAGGTATSGSDYTATTATLTILPGNSTGTFTLPITDDSYVEQSETAVLTFSDPSEVTLGSTISTTLTITDNDVATSPFGNNPLNPLPLGSPVVAFGSVVISPYSGIVAGFVPIWKGSGSCGCGGGLPDPVSGPMTLIWNNGTVNVKPIVEVTFASDPNGAVPTQLEARLNWNSGGFGGWTTFSTTGHSAGDVYLMAIQVGSAVTSTGYYSYTIEVKATYAVGSPVTVSQTNNALVVAQGSSSLGSGWNVSGLDKIVAVTGGVMWVYGSGGVQFFTDAGGGSYTSPADNFGTLVKNGNNTYTYTAKDQVVWQFDTGGLVTSVTDPTGLARTFTYSSGKISTIASVEGTATFSYDGSNKLNKIDVPGRTWTITVDGNGDLTNITLPDGSLRTLTYSSNRLTNDAYGSVITTVSYEGTNGTGSGVTLGVSTLANTPAITRGLTTTATPNYSDRLGAQTDALSLTTTFAFDGQGRTTKITTPDSQVQQFDRDSAGQVTVAIDQGNRRTTFGYSYGSGKGDLTLVTHPDGTTLQYQYDSTFHKPTVVIDELGNRTTSAYDPTTGELLTVKDAQNNITTMTYSGGRLESVKNPLNQITTYLYNASKRLETVLDAAGNRTTSYYDAAGNLTGTKDANNNLTQFLFDAQGRQTVTIDAASNRTTSYFDASGNLTGSRDANSNLTQYLYDSAGRLTVTIDAASNRTTSYLDAAGNLTGSRDANGNLTQYLIDSLGRATVTIDAATGRTTSFYDVSGRLTGTRDANNNLTEYLFDSMGRQTVTIDAATNRTTSYFDAAGHLTGSRDANSNLTQYLFDSVGRQTVTIDAASGRTTSYFDAAGNLTGSRDLNGNLTQFLIDSLGRATVTIDAANGRTTSFYDVAGNLTGSRDANNNLTQYLVDALGRATATIDAASGRTTSFYDAAGNVTGSRDANNNLTQYLFDALNRATVTIDAGSNRTTSYFDAAGNLTGSRDAASNLTQHLIDALNRSTVTVDAATNRTTSYFDAAGNVTGARDARNNLTQYLFDALNRATVTIDALSNRTTSYFDAAGNLTGTRDARSNLTQFVVDALNRQTVVIDALTNRTTSYLDAAGNLTGTKDARNNLTQYLIDGLNRATVTIDAITNRTTSYFDAAGNLTGSRDGNNNLTQFVFDALNRQTVTVDALSNRTTSFFDAAGNLTGMKDASNNVTAFAYDALNRQTSMTDPHTKTATFAYNALGLMTGTTDRLGRSREFTYDAMNRLTQTVWKNSGGSATETLTYSFDANGNQLTATNSQGTYTMSYDALNRVTVVTDLWSKTLTFTYDAVGNRTKVEDSANGVLTSTYDAANNLTKQEFGGTGQTVLRVDTLYNATNQVETINRYSDLAGNTRVATTTYTYDADNRVSNILNKDASNNTISNLTYTYDAGNRVQTEVLGGTTKTFTYDTTDQLTADGTTTVTYDGTGNRNNGSYTTGTGNRMTGDGTWTYTYDDEGNMTKKSQGASAETWTYGYDNENHLTTVEKRATDGGTLQQKTEFVYNALGLRVQKRVDTDGNGTWDSTQRYAWDGWNPAKAAPIGTENFDVWADLDGSSSLTTRYLRGDVVDELLARTDSGTAYWELGDRLGSIRTIIDNSAVVKDTVTYDAWGNATHTNSSFAGRYLWTGREWDSEISLQYNRARFYDPASGRWVSQDPLGFDAGDGNLYRYLKNEHQRAGDPSGQFLPEDHERITRSAIEKWASSKNVPTSVGLYVRNIVVGSNLAQDFGPSFASLEMHFNRPYHLGDEDAEVDTAAFLGRALRGKSWDNKYSSFLDSLETLFFATGSEDCQTRLETLGKMTHAWQDFYAHAVRVDQGGKTFVNNSTNSPTAIFTLRNEKLGSENSFWPGFSAFADKDMKTGDPKSHSWFIPSSYSITATAEHPRIDEPLKSKGPEYSARLAAAEAYTSKSLSTLLNAWYNDCKFCLPINQPPPVLLTLKMKVPFVGWQTFAPPKKLAPYVPRGKGVAVIQ